MSAALECEIVTPAPLAQSLSSSFTPKQKLFIKFYLETGNGTDSARRAGYAGDDNVLGVCAYDLLRNPKIRAELTRICNPIADAEEVMARLTKYSRSSMADVLDGSGQFDIDYAKQNHSDDLIKKLKIKRRVIPVKDGEPEVEITHELEIHDAKDATIQLAKIHRLLDTKIEVQDTTERDPVEMYRIAVNRAFEQMGLDIRLEREDALKDMEKAMIDRSERKLKAVS